MDFKTAAYHIFNAARNGNLTRLKVSRTYFLLIYWKVICLCTYLSNLSKSYNTAILPLCRT